MSPTIAEVQARAIPASPLPCCSAAHAAELLAESDTRDAMQARLLTAHAEGLAEGLAESDAAWMAGYAQCAADVKAAQHAIYGPLAREAEAEARRWIVRGEIRTRATFAEPHPSDYLGGPVAWAVPVLAASPSAAA